MKVDNVDAESIDVISPLEKTRRRRLVRFVDSIKVAFQMQPAPKLEGNEVRDQIDRVVVGARSHGNMRLQHGLFYTQRNLDAQYDRVRKLDFSE